MIEVLPAILPKSFKELEDKLTQVVSHTSFVQIDICDGKFTPEKTWPYIDRDDPDFIRLINEEAGLPYWEDLKFEIDLMVENVEEVAEQWVHVGAERIIVHFESFSDAKRAESFIENFKNRFHTPDSAISVEIGLAVNIDTPFESFAHLIPNVETFQCMGILRIGYQGEPFDEQVLEKIKSVHEKYPHLVISVDGGVNLDSAPLLRQAGATRLIAGSVILKSNNIPETIEKLKGHSPEK